MPTETQLEQRVAALQSDLNAKDQVLDDAATENNERELSRRDWFDEARRLEKEVEALRKALKFYADQEHYHFESGNWDTVSGEPLNILWCGDEPDFIEDGTVARAALSASAELGAKPQAEPVYMVRTHGSCCWEEVGSGSLEDFQSMPEEYELRALYTHPAEQPEPVSSTSDKYKAELYDEVWQLARGMGYGNVTDALMKLQGNKP